MRWRRCARPCISISRPGGVTSPGSAASFRADRRQLACQPACRWRQLIGSRLPNSLLLAGITAAFCVPVALALGIDRGDLARLALRPRGRRHHRHRRFRPGVPGRDARRAAVRRESALAARDLLRSSAIHSPAQFLRVFAMPVMTLSFVIIAQMARMTRAALINVLDSSYVEMALLKGARPIRIVLRHALPNALGPIVNAVALSLSFLLGGVIIVETIFNYPGLAKLMVDAVATRDMPLVQACAMIFCAAYLLLVTFADVCCHPLQPAAALPMSARAHTTPRVHAGRSPASSRCRSLRFWARGRRARSVRRALCRRHAWSRPMCSRRSAPRFPARHRLSRAATC